MQTDPDREVSDVATSGAARRECMAVGPAEGHAFPDGFAQQVSRCSRSEHARELDVLRPPDGNALEWDAPTA